MDDANVPSLLSLSYLGFFNSTDPLYINTRKFVLGEGNPYHFSGSAGAGVGSPHTGAGWIWPISLSMQALTSENDAEIMACLKVLRNAAAATGFQHESFWKDDTTKFSRPWFAWANSLFGELIITIAKKRPWILQQQF